MKNLAYSLIFSLLLITACKKDAAVEIPQTAQEAEYTEQEFQITDIDELEDPEIQIPEENQEFSVQLSSESGEENVCERKEAVRHDWNGTKCRCGKKHTYSQRRLPLVLQKLNLTARQKEAVKGYLADHRNCICEHHKKAHRIMHAVRDSIHTRHLDLLQAKKSGRITKSQFESAMRDLHQAFKARLKSHNERNMHIRIMRHCREELFKNIASVLDNDQLSKWKQWRANHK